MTKTTKTLLFGIPVLIGAYLIFKQIKKPKPTPAPNCAADEVLVNGVCTPKTTPAPAPTGCSNYKVTTASSNLNVRSTPSTSAAIVGSLAKDSIVSVKASSTAGWMQLCDNSGYVSSLYLTKTASFSGGVKTGKRKFHGGKRNASGLKGLKFKFSGGVESEREKIMNFTTGGIKCKDGTDAIPSTAIRPCYGHGGVRSVGGTVNASGKLNLNGSFEDAFMECFKKCFGISTIISVNDNPNKCLKDCLNGKGWNSDTGEPLTPTLTPTPKSTPKSTTLTNFM